MIHLLQNYVRNLIDFENSVLGGKENFDKIEEYLSKGDNVVILANHQNWKRDGDKLVRASVNMKNVRYPLRDGNVGRRFCIIFSRTVLVRMK